MKEKRNMSDKDENKTEDVYAKLTKEDIDKIVSESKFEGGDLYYHALVNVYENSPFWGEILSNIRKIETEEGRTLSVCFDPRTNRFEMRYNPKFLVVCKELMADSDYKDFAPMVVRHEVGHIVWGHCTDRSYHELFPPPWANKCMDVTVNHSVNAKNKYITKDGKVFFTLCTAENSNWEKGRTTEWYLSQKDNMSMMDKIMGMLLDDHDGFGKDMDGEGEGSGKGVDGDKGKFGGSIADRATDEIRRIVKQAVDQVRAGRGTIPGGMEERIAAIMGWKVDWKKVFKKLIFEANERSKNREYTRMRPSKRYGLEAPGTRNIRQSVPPMLMGLDVSGSVSDAEIGEYIGDINRLIKIMDAIVDVVSFDTQVGKVTKRAKKIKTLDVVGRGGTDYNELVETYNKNKGYKYLVVFTDGHCPLPSVKSNNPIYWFVWGKGANKEFKSNKAKDKVYFVE